MQSASDASPVSGPRRSERVVVIAASLILFVVLLLAFARLGESVGLEGPPPSTEPPVAAPTPPATPLAPGVATATGSLAPDPAAPAVASTVPAGPTVTTPATAGDPLAPTTTLAESPLPERWPVSLPDPGPHEVLAVEIGEEERWLLAVPGNVPLAGGRFVAGLEDRGWTVRAVSTPRTLTAVGELDPERVSVTLRPDASLPQGWLLLEVVYQATIPDFDPPSTTTVPPRDAVVRRS